MKAYFRKSRAVSFYAAVEFSDHVPQETRARLESALKEMGILDTLIVPEQLVPKTAEQRRVLQSTPVHDRVLKPDPQIPTHSLADYLYPTPVAGSQVTSVQRLKLIGSKGDHLVLSTAGKALPKKIQVEDLLSKIYPSHIPVDSS